jgi:hypothetical protein
MGPRDRAEDAKEDAEFRVKVLAGLGSLQAQSERMEASFNGRVRKLEHAVFGDEEAGKVGVTERLRGLESGWAKLTTVAILVCSIGIEGTKWIFSTASAWLTSGAKAH